MPGFVYCDAPNLVRCEPRRRFRIARLSRDLVNEVGLRNLASFLSRPACGAAYKEFHIRAREPEGHASQHLQIYVGLLLLTNVPFEVVTKDLRKGFRVWARYLDDPVEPASPLQGWVDIIYVVRCSNDYDRCSLVHSLDLLEKRIDDLNRILGIPAGKGFPVSDTVYLVDEQDRWCISSGSRKVRPHRADVIAHMTGRLPACRAGIDEPNTAIMGNRTCERRLSRAWSSNQQHASVDILPTEAACNCFMDICNQILGKAARLA